MKNLKNCIILSLFLSILLVPITFHLLDIQESGKNSELEFGYLNSAGSWVLDPFAINPYGTRDYTWIEFNATDWCSGAGTELDPWIIENITIDSGGLSDCLEIGQSDDYFIIRNCTFKNSHPNYGLYIWSTSNGIVEDCTFFNNTIALYMSSPQNNTVQYNYFYNNTGASIRIYGLSNNMNNTVRHNRFVNRLTSSLPTAFAVQGINNKLINNTVDNFFFGVNLDYANQTVIKSNTFISGWRGISNGGHSFNATIFNNTISGTSVDGISSNSNGSIYYKNNLFNNDENANDNGHFNRWDNGVIGNYWDDYGGSDLNDDGIGDTPYSLPGSGSSQDNFPIWEDGDDTNPTLTLNSPAPGSTFGNDAPTFNLDVFDVNLDQAWYVINYTSTKYFFTPTNGVNLVSIDETAWDALVQGSLVISFFVNDTASNEETLNVDINKEVAPIISLVEPLGGSIFGEDAPTFNITIYDVNLDQAWYVINNTSTKYFFTPTNGVNLGSIDETAWDALVQGSLVISFFVNDTAGNEEFLDVDINKEVAPIISLIDPLGGSTFGNDAPTFNLDISDVNLDQAWYVINNTSTKYFFTPTNGVNLGSIDETAWDALVQGSLVISFFVNDTASNEENLDVNINKDVAPQISLVEPLGGSIFAEDAPFFNITLFDVNFDQAWYTINSGTTKFFFNPLNGLNHIPINQTAWEGLPEGSVIISFFINDTGGNINSLDVTINKDLPPPPTPPPGIPFGNYYIVFMGIGIISLLIIVSRKRKLIHS